MSIGKNNREGRETRINEFIRKKGKKLLQTMIRTKYSNEKIKISANIVQILSDLFKIDKTLLQTSRTMQDFQTLSLFSKELSLRKIDMWVSFEKQQKENLLLLKFLHSCILLSLYWSVAWIHYLLVIIPIQNRVHISWIRKALRK